MGKMESFSIEMDYLKTMRKVHVYLPENYSKSPQMHFPVLYMQDGQNVFINAGAFGNQSWEVVDTMNKLEEQGKTEGIIVIGIENEGERRFDDYSPWQNAEITKRFLTEPVGGAGDAYADFFVNTLKAYVDKTYRTKPEPEYTAIAGSSMGSFISTYIMAKYPHVFSKLGAFSTAAFFNEAEFLSYISSIKFDDQRCFISVGTNEVSGMDANEIRQEYINNSIHLFCAFIKQGVKIDHLHLKINWGETHCEAAWSKHFQEFIEFAFEL